MPITYGDLNAISSLSNSDWSSRNFIDKAGTTAVASLVDIGTTMWNSIMPESTGLETSTRGILQSIGLDGAVSAYDNNRDAVDALSFVGGVLIPGAGAFKLSQGVRAGLKGTSWLSPVRAKDDLVKMQTLLENGMKGTSEWKSLSSQSYLRGQATNLIDNAAAELAIMGTFNAHPYMEDYLKDPIENFGISMAIGGVLGGGISALATRSEIGQLVGRVETGAIDEVIKSAKLYDVPYADGASSMVSLKLAKDNLDSLAQREDMNQLTRDAAKSFSNSIDASIGKIFQDMTSDAVKAVPDEAMARIKETVTRTEFQGADKIDFYKPANTGFAQTSNFLPKKVAQFMRKNAKDEDVFVRDAYYNQDLGGFLSKSEADQAANAADVYTKGDIQTLARNYSNKAFNLFDNASDLARTADVEAMWLGRIRQFNDMPTKKLLDSEIAAGDLPAMNAWASSVQKRKTALEAQIADTENPLEGKALDKALSELGQLNKASVKLFNGETMKPVKVTQVTGVPTDAYDVASYVKPSYFADVDQAFEKGLVKPLLTEHGVSQAKGVVDDFYRYFKSSTGKNIDNKISARTVEDVAAQYARANPGKMASLVDDEAGLSSPAVLMLLRSVAGTEADKAIVASSMAGARSIRQGVANATPGYEAVKSIIDSPITKAQQDFLKRQGDQRGNVYAWADRTTVGGTSRAALRMHADDLAAIAHNGAGGWLVGATDSAPRVNTGKTFAVAGPEAVQRQYMAEQGIAISNAVKEGMAREVAALRYNTTPEMVDLAVANPYAFKQLADSQGVAAALAMTNRWSTTDHIEAALAPTRKTLRVSATRSRIMGETGAILQKHRDNILGQGLVNSSEKAALNDMDGPGKALLQAKVNRIDNEYNNINKMWLKLSIDAGQSQLAKTLYDEILDGDAIKVLREGLSQFVNGKGGNPLYSSADFVTSRMGEVGRLVTQIGDQKVRIANRFHDQYMEPLAGNMQKLLADTTARTEFAMFDNFRQSTKGFLQYSEESRTFITGDRMPDGTIANVRPATDMVVQSDLVNNILLQVQEAGNAIYNNQKTLNRLKGVQEPNDIGFWMPSVNLVNKEIAYVVNHDTGAIKMLVGNSADDLKEVKLAYNKQPNETILTRAELANVKTAQGYGDLLDDVGRADTDQMKKGVGLAAADTSNTRIMDIMTAYRDRINYQSTGIIENGMYDVMQKLDYLSQFNKMHEGTNSSTGFMKVVKNLQQKDTALDIRDYLLGQNPVYRNQFMGQLNKTTSATIQVGINAFNRAYSAAVKPGIEAAKGKDPKVDYEAFRNTLEAQGIQDPFAVFNEAARPALLERARNSGYTVSPDRLINASNSIASTLALKFMELAQPLTNMMSMPILTISTVNRAVKAHQINSVSGVLDASPLSVMMGGIRRMNSNLPENANYLKMFEEEGLLNPILSEVDQVMKQARLGTGGAIGQIEKALDSKFVQVMSKPSEVAETLVRKTTLMTGVELAKRLYGPVLSDKQVMIFARDFLKQSLGNYTTSQRPMMFQGSFGASMGLFQTYMLTYAQNMYRHLDLKDYKGLGQTMLAQAGIFGVGSLPGFQAVSTAIGEHFSDEHIDLTTGTYRALPDPLANVLIYGMPSNFAPDVHTRGDINPRVPSGFSTMVAPSILGQTIQTMLGVAKSIGNHDVGAMQGFMEGLSMQSVSRPIARISELYTGKAITQKGSQVAGNEEVWSWQGILARTFGTRTLAESKTREAMHLNSYYGAIDSEARKAVLSRLRTAIRSDSLTDDLMDDLATSYLRSGSPQGFRQAVNQAFMENDNQKLIDLTHRFGDSPLMMLVDDLD